MLLLICSSCAHKPFLENSSGNKVRLQVIDIHMKGMQSFLELDIFSIPNTKLEKEGLLVFANESIYKIHLTATENDGYKLKMVIPFLFSLETTRLRVQQKDSNQFYDLPLK